MRHSEKHCCLLFFQKYINADLYFTYVKGRKQFHPTAFRLARVFSFRFWCHLVSLAFCFFEICLF